MVDQGQRAPDFVLPSTRGGERGLADFRGRKLVVFFYSKDETPGCTREACDFRDNLARLEQQGAEVVGVSKDSIASHEKFCANHEIPFELLSDTDQSVAKAFGAFGEKVSYGKKSMGLIRSTFLIDEEGIVRRVWSPVKVDGHVEQVLAALKSEK